MYIWAEGAYALMLGLGELCCGLAGDLPAFQVLLQKGTGGPEPHPQPWLDVSGTRISLKSASSPGCLLGMVC